ncbi:hypothetical protein WN51_11798 [Melipona quadrifasciata]|uniref:Uncharacterized protein n=1 Tax=Melipona quadrifasciata TaxID=166423 RepID=A0A0M9A514_9HYME|nr:hypothetical protein WN51_11798 [Melipona quadrifasciata]
MEIYWHSRYSTQACISQRSQKYSNSHHRLYPIIIIITIKIIGGINETKLKILKLNGTKEESTEIARDNPEI